MHFRPIVFLFSFFAVTRAFGAGVAPDGFPTGQDTPEGVAVDLARAFITHDYMRFEKICVPPYGEKSVRESYATYCAAVKSSLEDEAKRKESSPDGPKSIGKVFAARRLSADGPAAYGHAVLGFDDVQFVDVGVYLASGDRSLNRTLVVKKDGKWFVHPEPSISPLLCKGLNEEDDSVTDWREKVKQPPATTPPVSKP
jgi:hypothetical protein